MTNPIKDIVKFNKEAGLLESGYSHSREPAYLIEEAMESFPQYKIDELANRVQMNSQVTVSNVSQKDLSRLIIDLIIDKENQPSDLELFDKHIDAFVYTVGSMAKLGLSPQQIEAGIHAVMHSNFKKLGSKKDDQGKLGKPDNWLEIEAEQNAKLQKILDQRQK
jgi:predicted HAD superfamily Cof-like phosphohydrolase